MLEISIVIPCFNHGDFIDEAISSIEQNVGEYSCEIIIVDDGSTDDSTIKILERLQLKGHTIIRQANKGLAAARNTGISNAKGVYIIPLDSDNKLHKNYLTKAIQILDENTSIDVVYGNPICFGDGSNGRQSGLKEIGEFNLNRILYSNYIDACAVFRKSIWEKVGGYDGQMPAMGHEDWEFWINIALNGGNFCFLNELCYYYRVDAKSMSAMDAYASVKHNSNKEYIYMKHSLKIITTLLERLDRNQSVVNYVTHNRLKSIAKLALGYKLL